VKGLSDWSRMSGDVQVRFSESEGVRFPLATRHLCMVQYIDDAQGIEQALRERFAKFNLELHPEKTRVISFGRYERENAKRQHRKANTFDFLGFTHYCGLTRILHERSR